MKIATAHATLGHGNELTMRKMAKYIGWEISQGFVEDLQKLCHWEGEKEEHAKEEQW